MLTKDHGNSRGEQDDLSNVPGRVIVMSVCDYLGMAKGQGILATAGGDGRVDVAVFAKPHVVDEDTVAFIMADRLLHHNLQCNPHAAYLFMEEGSKYTGMRLFLTKINEEIDREKPGKVRKKAYPKAKNAKEYLVSFRIDQVLPAVEPE